MGLHELKVDTVKLDATDKVVALLLRSDKPITKQKVHDLCYIFSDDVDFPYIVLHVLDILDIYKADEIG